VAAVAGCGAADRFVDSASPRATAPGRSPASSAWKPSSLPTRRAEGLSPPAGRPRISSAYIAVPDDRPAHVRRKTSHPRAHPPSAAGGRRSLCFAGNHGDSGETG
jgi:hypothetical protein